MINYGPWVGEFSDGFRVERVSGLDGTMQYLNTEDNQWYMQFRDFAGHCRFDTRQEAELALAVYLLTQ